ncbi:Tll0287-like domain-containing protein [Azospirillum rugosum]|uniref:Tll0287-like domain-containing protein n=1 Tax=Azospirillum rugosum TaxID=416170 RepID=A0ABS4SL84_9PROT|nr:DUF3365 domain-containing protein [Azospirillum rugosum]MBP2293326.1 hypothetical protein [Azospirillum rugosum]
MTMHKDAQRSRRPTMAAVMSALAVGAVISFVLAAVPAAAQDPVALKTEAAAVIKEYADSLGAALKGAIETGGPASAISVCHEAAPRIAADLGARTGWTVRRTSLKPRNPASAPTDYERSVLENFQARLRQGEDMAALARAETVGEGGQPVFRVTKAIPTGELCLACHGGAIKPEVQAKLDELYPGDTATGFKAGDMRGMFSLSKRL